MKKIISILLAVALLASLGVAALAEERTEEYEDMGINVTYPESFDGLKGVFYPYMMGKIADGVFIGEFLYFAMPEEDFERIMESAEPTEEEIELFQAAQNNLGYLIALSDGVTVEDLSDMLGLANPEEPRAVARHEILCTFGDVARSAAKLLKPGGHFYLVHRPFRLAEIMVTLHEYGLEPKRMRMVYPYIDREPNMVLLDAVRGGRPRLAVEKPLIVYEAPGRYTQEIYDVYGY